MTYRGYAVQSFAHRLPDGYFSANLQLENARLGDDDGRYSFYALDYFHSEDEAVCYSACWARNWIDMTCLISSGHFNLGERPRLLQLNNTAA
ncbi:ISBma1, transposase [Burkholderia pseudomallei]|nr:ISBma1, transposase [Burkholderia pseudomallei]CAJ6447263.1 ISBma1, transposase [Burkholderia pseudomallei]